MTKAPEEEDCDRQPWTADAHGMLEITLLLEDYEYATRLIERFIYFFVVAYHC
jgi:hypothetical protein